MKMNLKVSIGKNGTVGERAVPNLDGKAGVTRVGIVISIAGVTRVGIVISIAGVIKVGTEATRIEIGPNLKKEVNLTMKIGSMTLTLEITNTRGRSLATSRSKEYSAEQVTYDYTDVRLKDPQAAYKI